MLLSSAVEHGYLEKPAKNEMLKHKFWQSLSSDKLKAQTRHKYDSIASFDQLLAEIRVVEKQIEITPGHEQKVYSTEKDKHAHHNPIVTHQDLKDLEQRMDSKVEKLTKDIDDKFSKIMGKLDSDRSGSDFHRDGHGAYGHSDFDSHRDGGRGGYGRGRRYGRGGRYRGRGQSRGRNQNQNSSN